MELNHIGVLRLHDLALTNGQLSMAEAHHLHTCLGCMEVFEAFARQSHRIGSLSQRERPITVEDGLASADLPWAL